MNRIATLAVLVASFSVVGGLLLFGQNLERILVLWGESLQMSVYVREEADATEIAQLTEKLKADERIAKSMWVDKQAALQAFESQMASYAPDLLKDADLSKFVPASFQVQLKNLTEGALGVETLKSLATELESQSAVENVSYGQEWVKTYSSLVSGVTRSGQVLMIVLIAAAVLVISSSIAASIHRRRSEIEVLELVGAGKMFIRKPFLYQGAMLGFLSGTLALAILGMGFSFIKEHFSGQLAFLQIASEMRFLSISHCLAFVLAAGTLGLVSTALSLSRLNDGWAAAQNQRRLG